MKDKIIKAVIFVIILVCLFMIGMYTSIELVAYNDHFYEQQYRKNWVSETTGITDEQLMVITDEMQQFLKGKRADFNIYATVDGNYQAVFTQQEQTHMVDVQKLFIIFKTVRNICLIVLILLIAVLYKKQRKMLLNTMLKASVTILLLSLILGIGIVFFFEPLFIGFHQLFFTNELWLFDPATSVLINMVPEEFFIACAIRIVIYNLIYYAGIITLTILGKKRAYEK